MNFLLSISQDVSKSTQKQPSCENGATLKSLGEKGFEVKGGSQQMAAMMLYYFNNALPLLNFIIIAAICWPPP